MERARRHARLLSALAFGLLALVAELAGRSLTHRIDLGRHVASPSYAGTDYYPIMLAAVKFGVALLLARLLWRLAKAFTAERTAKRTLAAVGSRPSRVLPRIRFQLSAGLWLATFVLTSVIYLVQTDAESLSAGRWPLLGPWLHSSALPVFAALAVVVALFWGAVERWLADYEQYADAAVAEVRRLAREVRGLVVHAPFDAAANPRRLFGLAFESRPPPLPA
jgi:hypothetical protein